MKKILHLLLLTLGFVGLSVHAADSKPPQIPPGPMLNAPGAWCAWQISFSYAPNSAVPATSSLLPNRTRSIRFERTGTVWQALTEDIKGEKILQFHDGTDEFVVYGKETDASIVQRKMEGVPGPALFDFGKGAFPDLDWISPATFERLDSYQGRPCLVFVKDKTVVLVDEQTRFPVLWKSQGETRSFEQRPPPTTLLAHPEVVSKTAGEIKKVREAISRPVPRGG
jgi:hypothetical protein